MHHLPGGGFRNHRIGQINKPFSDLLKWRRESPGHPLLPFPLANNQSSQLRANTSRASITWIGHATVLLQSGGFNLLTDPHFSLRASPLPFAGPKRGTPPGIALEELPELHAVLISHNHYDHLDSDSIRALARRHPRARFFCPFGLGGFFAAARSQGCCRVGLGAKRESRRCGNHRRALPALEFARAVG